MFTPNKHHCCWNMEGGCFFAVRVLRPHFLHLVILRDTHPLRRRCAHFHYSSSVGLIFVSFLSPSECVLQLRVHFLLPLPGIFCAATTLRHARASTVYEFIAERQFSGAPGDAFSAVRHLNRWRARCRTYSQLGAAFRVSFLHRHIFSFS